MNRFTRGGTEGTERPQVPGCPLRLFLGHYACPGGNFDVQYICADGRSIDGGQSIHLHGSVQHADDSPQRFSMGPQWISGSFHFTETNPPTHRGDDLSLACPLTSN